MCALKWHAAFANVSRDYDLVQQNGGLDFEEFKSLGGRGARGAIKIKHERSNKDCCLCTRQSAIKR